MKFFLSFSVLMACLPCPGYADIFEHACPSDTALRDALRADREGYYFQTPGIDLQVKDAKISEVSALDVRALARPQGLRDMDKAFDAYLLEQLRKDRAYKGLVASNHPLVLLEYSSPVLADVVKHYRMSAYQRLLIEQLRLAAIERATASRGDRLGSQSQRECLKKNESRGLVEAMRICQKARATLDALVSVDGSVSLQDGRRRIHVLAQALARLGLDKSRTGRIVDMAGDTVLSDDGYSESFPKFTFENRMAQERQGLVRQWQEVLKGFAAARRVGAAKLEALSLPGLPVTAQALAGLELLEEPARELAVLKLASSLAQTQTAQSYREAAGYIGLCAADPALPEEFRTILLEKKDQLLRVWLDAENGRNELEGYKELLASLSKAADAGRGRLQRRQEVPALPSADKAWLLNL